MNDLISDFWNWANVTPEQYAEQGIDLTSDKVEFYYPKFEELLSYAEEIICQKSISDEEMDDLLTIMALDNETENILDYAADHLQEKHLVLFIEKGVQHFQPNARWQIAEFIYRRFRPGMEKYLMQLKFDQNAYVRKRTQNAIMYLKLEI